MLAVSAMSPTVAAVFLLVAVVAFVIAAVIEPARWNRCVAAGLAFWVFVAFWANLARA